MVEDSAPDDTGALERVSAKATGAPVEWEADVVLRDGTVAHVRPISPDDAEGIQLFHSRQSPESIYLRFFAPLRELSDRDIHRFTHVDHHDRVALVATLDGEIIGIGRYDRIDPRSAEVAFNISDHYQGEGIGSVMLEHLAAIAQEMGINRFVAEVLPQNRKMLTVFKEAGYEVTHHIEDGVVEVSFDISPTEQSKAVQLSREHRAEARSMHTILFPERVAIIGASRREESIGALVMRNILAAGYQGELYPIHRVAEQIQGVPAYPSIHDVPHPVDLAIVVVPAAQAVDVGKDCGKAGVKALLVLSAGFAEAGEEGIRLQEKLRRRVRRAGMRIVGPNSFGIVNNDPAVRLNATLASVIPSKGRLGLFAQSGALGVAVLASAARRGLGISVFASAGNRVDVSGNDLMQYWIDDQETDTVGLYLESMGNPRKFSRIARALAAVKPVVVVSSGVSSFAAPPGHRTRVTNVPPQASAEEFAAALDAAFADPEVDSVVAAFIPPLVTPDEEVHMAVRNIVADHEKPCVATFLGMRGVGDGLSYEQGGVRRSVPAYSMPEDGIRALNAVTRYALWRQRDRGTPVAPVGIDRLRAEALIEGYLAGSPEGRALTREEARELLSAYGIRVWPAV
jgi:succinyl-CoA synthetase alpha subunit/RimJ/RimL family protein N-acetyltransferase